jgi:ribosomal protein S18 acetylase RimI-like enzyme
MARPDFPAVVSLVVPIENFNKPEVDRALEQINLYLNDQNQSDSRVVVGENSSSEVSAYACWRRVPQTKGTYDLYWIVTDPGTRGQSFGQALMAYLQKRSVGRKERLLVVETSGKTAYTGTVEFYRRLGYKEISRLQDFYDVRDHKLAFVKRIP